MPQNPTNITESQEFKDFVKENNLEVLNLESIQLALYNFSLNQKENVNGFFDHDEKITEIAMNVRQPDIQKINENGYVEVTYGGTLFNKWNK